MKTSNFLLIICVYLITVHSQNLKAQDGALDNLFGIGGLVSSDFDSRDNIGKSLAITPEGRIYCAGWNYNGHDSDFALFCYHSDGSLDNTFGVGGIITTDISGSGSDDICNSMILQEDGKVVLAGYSEDNFAIVRYNSDGSLDDSFGIDGKVLAIYINDAGYSRNTYCKSVAIQTDNKLLLGGDTDGEFAIARFNEDGSIDNTFGIDGYAVTDFGGDDIGYSLALQDDGKIILGGMSDIYYALARYDTDGILDTSFDIDGIVINDIPAGGLDACYSLAIQTEGKILAAGVCSGNFSIVRYNIDGSIDNTFGTDGYTITDFGGDDIGYSIALQDDGKIIVAGKREGELTTSDFAITRYTIDGLIDSTFGIVGKVITDFYSEDNICYKIAIQGDDKILAAGYSYNGLNKDFAIARYNSSPVLIDESLHQNFIIVSPNPFINDFIIKGTSQNGSIIIYDLLGVEIAKQEAFNSETKVNLENLPQGFYLLNYADGNYSETIEIVKI